MRYVQTSCKLSKVIHSMTLKQIPEFLTLRKVLLHYPISICITTFQILTIEMSKSHADCNHQSKYNTFIETTTELAFTQLLRGFSFLFSKQSLFRFWTRNGLFPSTASSKGRTGLMTGFITTWFIIARLRWKYYLKKNVNKY